MRVTKAWIVATKDMRVFLRKRYAMYSLFLLPLIVGIGFPVILGFTGARHPGTSATQLSIIMNSFSIWFIIIATIIPVALAAYSLVGEKVEKSLEPLLATPITDSELLLGKSLGAFIPSIAAIYASAIIFMVLSDLVTHNTLGYAYFPNWTIGLILLLVVPLSAILSVEANVLISSKANDARAAQMQGTLIAIPYFAIYVLSETKMISLNIATFLIISGIILVVDIVLFFLSIKTFQREEILTKWT